MTSSATFPVDGNLTKWVSQVQERHRGGTDAETPTQPSDELADEIQRSRAERAKRRSQALGGGGGGGGGAVLSPATTGDVQVEERATTGTREATLQKLVGEQESPETMKMAYALPSFGSSSSSPPKRAQGLLDRYGGSQGPTGVARAGTRDAPASLASFMGGKASGPRLGKLQGDGRTTPPEAKMIDYTDHRPLPGMATNAGGGRSLASFLEARAAGQGQSFAPSDPSSKQTSEVTQHGETMQSPGPSATRTSSGDQYLTTSSPSYLSSSDRKDRATSPLKAEQIQAAKELAPTQRLEAGDVAATSPLPSPSFLPSKTPSQSTASNVGVSPAFSATQQSADRMPTASLTRLKSKKMVEQRVREAQERSSQEHSPSTSPITPSAPAWTVPVQDSRNTAVKGRWPEVQPSPSSPVERKGGYMPGQFGNALPGMGKPQTGPTRNLYAVNKRDSGDTQQQYSSPVRLPGMGSAESPFISRQVEREAEQEDALSAQPLEPLTKGRAKPKRAARPSAGLQSEETTHTAREDRSWSSRQEAPSSTASSRALLRTPSPAKSSQPLSVDTHMTQAASRQDSIPMPDSAEKRIADSTAALEALVQGKRVSTPVYERSKVSYRPEQMQRKGTLRIARNKDSHVTVDTSLVSQQGRKSHRNERRTLKRTVSVEVLGIKNDGSYYILASDDQRVLYETETQIIVHRFREATSDTAATIYVRAGRLSKVLTQPQSKEAKMAQDIGKQHRADLVDCRQGREPDELAEMLGGYLVTREGSRNSQDDSGTLMFEVRGWEDVHYIDQVDMLTSSLCSANSAIVVLQGEVFLWHGIGSTTPTRRVAREYGQQLTRSKMSEYEEGAEDELFWTCFDRATPYSNAWHHRFRHILPAGELSPRLYSVQGMGSSKKIAEQMPFSSVDVRRDGVHILQLPLEIFVLVGPEARSRRREIHACIEAASALAKQVARRRGVEIMTPPVHVVVFPSIVPRELKSALRYWHDEHLNGKSWQRAALGMNVWERQSALEQLQRDEFPFWQLNDELFLPVGVGLEDVQGIDI